MGRKDILVWGREGVSRGGSRGSDLGCLKFLGKRRKETKLHLPKSIHKQPPWPGSSLARIPPSIHILNASS